MAINYDTASSGGIDQQIQDKADTYRNNPQALQQEYKVSGDLMDLLVLQEMNKRRKAIQNEMAMQMEQKPQSVAEQEYEEAKGGIKDDIVKQTGKLLQEKQKRAVTNQQRMMAGVPAAARRRPPTNMAGITGVPPRAPVNPRGTGIASNRVPSSPTTYGAGGGIVSFANTGLVSGQSYLKKYGRLSPAALKQLGYTQQKWAGLSDTEQQAIVDRHVTTERMRSDNLLEQDPNIRVSDEKLAQGDSSFIERELAEQRRIASIQEGEDLPQDPTGNLLPSDFVSTNRPINRQSMSMVPAEPEAEPEDGQSTFERIGNIETPALDIYSMPEGIGQVDTTDIPGQYNWTDLTLPSQTEKGRLLAENRQELFEQQSTLLAQDPSKQRGAAAAWADEQTGKAGIADANTRMLQERRDMLTSQAEARDKSGLYDLLAYGGGQGAFANIGRAAADRRRAGLLRDERQLMGTHELEKQGLEQLRMAGDTAVQAGMKAEELSSAEKRTAATQMAEILRQQGDDLTEEAKLVLRQESDKMSEHAANRRNRITIATENASAELQKGIHELNGKLTTQTNEIRRKAVDSDNLRTVQMGITEAAKNIGLIKAKVSADFARVLQNDPTYMQLNKADQVEGTNKAEAYLKKQRIAWDIIADNIVSELEEIQRQGYHKYNILMEKIAPTGGVQVTGIAGQT
jgi:hypothetical protein